MAPCLNTVDFALIGAMGVTALIGLSRGFIRELASILAWVLAGIVTFWDIPILQALMKAHISSAFVADVVAGLLVFVIAFAIVSLIGTLCANFVRGTTVSPVDRLFGTALGAAKGFFLLSCVELVAVSFVPRPEMPEGVQQSFLMPFVAEISDGVRSILPQEFQVFLSEVSSKSTGSYAANRDRLTPLPEAPAPSSPSETKGTVDELFSEETSPTQSDTGALPSQRLTPRGTGEEVRDLAVLSPKSLQDQAMGGNYTLDQKATLDRMLDAELAPVTEDEFPSQDPFAQEARERVETLPSKKGV